MSKHESNVETLSKEFPFLRTVIQKELDEEAQLKRRNPSLVFFNEPVPVLTGNTTVTVSAGFPILHLAYRDSTVVQCQSCGLCHDNLNRAKLKQVEHTTVLRLWAESSARFYGRKDGSWRHMSISETSEIGAAILILMRAFGDTEVQHQYLVKGGQKLYQQEADGLWVPVPSTLVITQHCFEAMHPPIDDEPWLFPPGRESRWVLRRALVRIFKMSAKSKSELHYRLKAAFNSPYDAR